MLSKLKKSNNRGFTIIEVMIVLAIAGLILLIVFLAVPALQRSSRNNGRRSDAARINSATTNFITNKNGTLPSTAADLTAILADTGTLSQYPTPPSPVTTVPTADIQFGVVAGTPGGIASYNYDSFLLVTGAVCGAGSTPGTIANNKNASPRASVLIYPQETGTAGTYTLVCTSAS